MVSIITALIAASAGFMVYLAAPILVMNGPVTLRRRLGTFYLKMAARVLKQFTFVRRELSGYDVLPINVDDEQKLLKVTLSSSTLGENNEYRFADPDNRILRLYNKPVTITYEQIPAALDADLAEWGHWVSEKQNEEDLLRGDPDDPESVKVDPYVAASDELRLIDPVDAFELVSNDVDAENIKTTEKLTKERYKKYDSGIGMKQTLRVMFGFAVGAGGVMAVQYVNEEVIGSGGGGGGGAPVVGNHTLQLGPLTDPGLLMDTVVMLL